MLRKLFAYTAPTIFGIKTSTKKPVIADDVTGIHYPKWIKREAAAELQKSPKMQDILKLHLWHSAISRKLDVDKVSMTELEDILGPNHIITKYVKTTVEASHTLYSYNNMRGELSVLANLLGHTSDVEIIENEIVRRYPLLDNGAGTQGLRCFTLIDSYRQEWYHYIQIIDSVFGENT
jgi:hypothetical protein